MAVWMAVSGGKNVGKTSVIEQIIRALKPLGYRIATVKHTHLSIEPDIPSTDTFRHRQAGAETTVLSAPEGYFLYRKTTKETPLPHSISNLLSESDIVLCEGFYHSDIPKIVIESSEIDEKTSSPPNEPIILKTRLQQDPTGIPKLPPEDLAEVISYIKAQLKLSG